MAWLQNLAGRAEDLLNKIDQNAANVLNENKVMELRTSLSKSSLHSLNENVEQEDASRSFTKSNPEQVVKVDDEIININSVDDLNFEIFKTDTTSSRSSSLNNSFSAIDDCQRHLEKISKLEVENHDLNKEILNLQHLYSETRNENFSLRNQIENINSLVTNAQVEMEQYKARAHKILQEKEQLISLNKQETTSDSNENILHKYNEELKKELNFQLEKNKELCENINSNRKEITSLQEQIVIMQNSFQQTNEKLEKVLNDEKHHKDMFEEEYKSINQKLIMKEEELAQQSNNTQLKNEEIERLKQVIKQKTNMGSEDYDLRIKSLTETLMQKQNSLETITTQRNALKFQLEKLENDCHKNVAQLQRSQVRVINVNDTDDDKSQVPQFMRISPLDVGVTRRVKHAYSTLDAVSIRTGVFLRRYPVARVFVFCYMIFLQLWALFVLFSYAPSNR